MSRRAHHAFYTSAAVMERIKEEAEREHRSVSQWVGLVLLKYLERQSSFEEPTQKPHGDKTPV